MTTVRETFNKVFSSVAEYEYRRGRDDGYAQAIKDFEAVLADFIADRPVSARRDAPPEEPAPKVRKRRKVTPTETRILDFVRANPGCTTADIEAAGIVARATLYRLVTRRKLRRVVDPKPHTQGRPWVHFYPPEPRNGQT